MAPGARSSGRINRAGNFRKQATIASGWQHANSAYAASTQSPPSVQPQAAPYSTAPGGVQTSGDMTAPHRSPVPYPGDWGPEQTHEWWSAENQSDTLIHRIRHGYFQSGTERAGRVSSQADPPSSGPAMPSFKAVNTTWNWQAGTGSAYEDNLSRDYTWLGQQDGSWSAINGGTPGFYRQGPGGAPVMTQPNDGPQRVWPGPPHGLHTWTPPDYAQTLARYNTVPQMVGARVDRLSNSRAAGQSYSQTTQHQGATTRRRGNR